jgi:hypothetical protein
MSSPDAPEAPAVDTAVDPAAEAVVEAVVDVKKVTLTLAEALVAITEVTPTRN